MAFEEENEQNQQISINDNADDGISVPNWLIEAMGWIPRMQMANSSLSFSCRTFKRLCWFKLHGNVKAHRVPYLKFCYQPNKFGDIHAVMKGDEGRPPIPIGKTSPSDYYILGFDFEHLDFKALNVQIIELAQNIAAHSKITLSIKNSMFKWKEDDENVALMQRLMANLSIFKLHIFNKKEDIFTEFYRLFSVFFNKFTFIDVWHPTSFDFYILTNWLHQQKTDGQQKMLNIEFSNYCNNRYEVMYRQWEQQFVQSIKKQFSTAQETALFLISLNYDYGQFIVENNQTNEMLTLYNEMDPQGRVCFFLARYPRGEKHWKEKSLEKFQKEAPMTFHISEMEKLKDRKNNKANFLNYSPNLMINHETPLIAIHSGPANGYNSVRAEMCVEFLDFNLFPHFDKYIACYFEVKILNHCGIGIGFNNELFPLKDDGLGSRFNSIGFWQKSGAFIGGHFFPFGKFESNDLFQKGDVIGCGLLQCRQNSLLKFFATHNGILLGLIELSDKFHHYEHFPTICSAFWIASSCVNFGKEQFCFDRSELFKKLKQNSEK